MLVDLVTAFGLIAVAELGDKSQLLALTFATRYRWWQVLAGVAIAAALLLGLAAAVGGVLGAALPDRALALGGGVVFLAFGAWTWWSGDEDEEPGEDGDAGGGVATRTRTWKVLVTVTSAFVIAELGDKTMLGTAALAGTRSPLAVWLGAWAGMTAVSGVAVLVGRLLHRRLPAHRLRQVAAVAFVAFGVLLLVEGIRS